MQSRLTDCFSSWIDVRAKRPQNAGTAKMLKTAEPTIVPTPMSPFSVTNVPTQLTSSSGKLVATVIKVPMKSLSKLKSETSPTGNSLRWTKLLSIKRLTWAQNLNRPDEVLVTDDCQHQKTITRREHVNHNSTTAPHSFGNIGRLSERRWPCASSRLVVLSDRFHLRLITCRLIFDTKQLSWREGI